MRNAHREDIAAEDWSAPPIEDYKQSFVLQGIRAGAVPLPTTKDHAGNEVFETPELRVNLVVARDHAEAWFADFFTLAFFILASRVFELMTRQPTWVFPVSNFARDRAWSACHR
jgi:hypothetical protein